MGMVRRREDGWRWEGVTPRAYASGAEKHVLIGPEDGAGDVELRYFRIPAGSASALERHEHEHAVLILHGRATVRLGDRREPAGPGDAVFVSSGELHQLVAGEEEDLGFLCTALARRAGPAGPDAVRALALALPGAAESAHMGHPDFRVGGRIFATLWPERDEMRVRLALPEAEALAAEHPGRMHVVQARGRFGWLGVRLEGAGAGELRALLGAAWRLRAPAAQRAAGPPPADGGPAG